MYIHSLRATSYNPFMIAFYTQYVFEAPAALRYNYCDLHIVAVVTQVPIRRKFAHLKKQIANNSGIDPYCAHCCLALLCATCRRQQRMSKLWDGGLSVMYKHLPVQCIAVTRLGFRVISPNIHKKVSLGQALDTSQLRKRSRI